MIKLFCAFLLLSITSNAQVYSVYFQTDRSNVLNQYSKTLDSVILEAKHQDLPVGIFCHCDDRADSTYNYLLSLRRANAVKKYLEQRGTFSQIHVKGFGESHPDFPNTPQLRYKNRRCDVKIGAALGGENAQNLSSVDITKVKKGSLLQLDGLEFVGNQAVPNDYSMPVLYELFGIMQKHPDLKILLKGHVCCSDDLPLSVARAEVVYKFLVANGIDSSRMSFRGFSNLQPLVKEVDAATEQKNRRVEILVKENSKVVLDDQELPAEFLFAVALRDIRFKPNSNYPIGQTQHNLQLLAKMISASEGYEYVLYVHASNMPLVGKRRSYLENYFRRYKIFGNKMKFVPSRKYNPDKGDMLILEVKPKDPNQ